MILYLRQAIRGNVPYLKLLVWGKMMSRAVFMTNLIPTDRIQYHRSCYESYTSKINLEKFELVEAQMNASACGSVRTSESICVKTRSMTAPFDWSQCIFCKQKSYQKDRNLKHIESKDRIKNILHAVNNKSDFDMVSLIQSVDNFLENALYHSSCIANYILNMKSDTVPVEKESEHESAFQQFIDSLRDDLFVNKNAFSMSFLLDKFCSFLPTNMLANIQLQNCSKSYSTILETPLLLKSNVDRANLIQYSVVQSLCLRLFTLQTIKKPNWNLQSWRQALKTLSRNLSDLYDPKGSAKSVHRDLNKLRVKLALSKDSSLVKLPPSEAAFRQHILCVAFQVYVWTHANEAKPPPIWPLEYGWRNENKYLMPKYFEAGLPLLWNQREKWLLFQVLTKEKWDNREKWWEYREKSKYFYN